ncbi:MAG: FtsK/SpoIIIE domain-containing protein, partial [Coriobacteriales bacterium]
HEKVHGPHGLIAGTTGSGKSEFIITYVLSMCLNYPPDQVAFVLIDYKGGGLAGAFDNDRFHLPHLSGTITNLDGAAITRSLTSIKSELKRRQDVLNKARDITGEATVDIYKYLSYYRQGVLTEPLPHLFIVADEFAELKQQEPEFMDELVSAARIGRSLGVHLILATQKPTGVVNDQILSNSRFKICLKVADAADSKEMIRRPDAAEIDRPGCFYMLIGYNEQFSSGQAAYAGGPYTPSDHFEPKVDDAVEMIDVGGNVVAAVRPPSTARKSDTSELNAVLAEIERAAEVVGKRAPMLWLEPLASHIVADELLEKYPHQSAPFVLDPVIGELDDPERQEQRPLDIPISEGGNLIIYGSPDSGIESLVLTMLYEMCEEQDAAHLNLYLFDFGSEALACMRAYPQVGEVILSADEEKVDRAFTMLETELAERRALFSEYGGSYERYCAEHDDRSAIFVVVNGIAVFNELYEDHFMRLVVLAREGLRAGIFMCITASTGTDARMRLRACFKQTLVLSLNDSGDYVSVLGSMRGVPEPSGDCRGLVKLDDTLYIFQGAHVAAQGEDDFVRVQTRGAELGEASPLRARPVPMLPRVVTSEVLRARTVALPDIPMGIFEGDLQTAVLEFSERSMERCVFSRTRDGAAFVSCLVKMLAETKGLHPVLFDAAGLLEELPGVCETESRDAAELVDFLQNLVLKSVKGEADASQVVFVSGIASALTRANSQVVSPVREYLKTRRAGEGPAFVLFDGAMDCGYGPEEWFKAQIGSRDGIWVGEGIDAQSAIQIGYTPGGERPDPGVKGPRGYVVRSGKIRRVKLLSETQDEKEG